EPKNFDPSGDMSPEILERLSQMPLENLRAHVSRRIEVLWFNSFHPGHQALQGPILLDHDMPVEEVRDDVLDPHLARDPQPPAIAGACYLLQHPVSPDTFGAKRPPVS